MHRVVINLIGEHTDYNDGFVLPCAIDYETVVAIQRRDDDQVVVIAADYANQRDEFSLGATDWAARWSAVVNYIRGVVKYLLEKTLAWKGWTWWLRVTCQGAGLSSSASLEVAIGESFNQAYPVRFGPGSYCTERPGSRKQSLIWL